MFYSADGDRARAGRMRRLAKLCEELVRPKKICLFVSQGYYPVHVLGNFLL
jgi:hypothetical protein